MEHPVIWIPFKKASLLKMLVATVVRFSRISVFSEKNNAFVGHYEIFNWVVDVFKNFRSFKSY